MQIEDKVKEIVAELSGEANVSVYASLQEDLALDSLAMVTLLLEVEDVFSVELDESDMNPFDLTTVQSVINLVNKYDGD